MTEDTGLIGRLWAAARGGDDQRPYLSVSKVMQAGTGATAWVSNCHCYLWSRVMAREACANPSVPRCLALLGSQPILLLYHYFSQSQSYMPQLLPPPIPKPGAGQSRSKHQIGPQAVPGLKKGFSDYRALGLWSCQACTQPEF